MSDSEAHVQARVVAGRYRLARELGRGGMGVVWLADDELVGRQVAVKELRPPAMLDDDEREKFVQRALQEARSAARIHHPGAVTLYDVLPARDGDDAVYLIMELIDGPTLADVIEQRGRLPEAEVARLGLQLVTVVEAAHALGIVHRDIKPGNILIAPGSRVKLTDFGIAHTLGDPRLTNSGIMGTQAYLAPELFEGASINPAADLWSVGATLFAAAEGRGPFDRDTTGATLRAILFDDLPVPHCSAALAAAISSMLQRDPARRATVRQVRESLHRVIGQPSAPDMPELDSSPTTNLSFGRNRPTAKPPQPTSPATPVSPVVGVQYPVPPAPAGPRQAGPRHAAPEPPEQRAVPASPPVSGPATAAPPPGSRPAVPAPPPMSGPARPARPTMSGPARPVTPPGPRPVAPPLTGPPRPAPPGPPAAVATFSNMPDDLVRILLIAGCVVAISIGALGWLFLPPGGYVALLLVAVAYVIVFFVIRSRWCQLTLTARGVFVRGGRSLNLNWDPITGFGLVMSGATSQLIAFVAGPGGGPPKLVPVCPLNPQHFPVEAIRAAILSHRPAMPIETQQPRYGYPLRPPPYL